MLSLYRLLYFAGSVLKYIDYLPYITVVLLLTPANTVLSLLLWIGGIVGIVASLALVALINTRMKECYQLPLHPADKYEGQIEVYRMIVRTFIKVLLIDLSIVFAILKNIPLTMLAVLVHFIFVKKYDRRAVLPAEFVCIYCDGTVEVECCGLKGTVVKIHKRAFEAMTAIGPADFIIKDYQQKKVEEILRKIRRGS